MNARKFLTLLISLLLFKAGAGTIELLAFSGIEGNGFITLNWQTRTEHDLKSLTLEKSSNAIDFQPVAVFHSDESPEPDKHYEFTDQTPVKGINYYRLKQTDKSGYIKYHKIIAVNYTRETEVLIFPNPVVKKEITVKLAEETETTLSISNSNGRTVYSKTFLPISGNEMVTVQLPELESGTYIFIIYTKDSLSTQRMFVTD